MARALDRKHEEIVILKADQPLPREQQTGFIMGPVSYSLRKRVVPLMEAGLTSAWVDLLIKECLLGVEASRPLRDSNGEEVPFKKSAGKKGRPAQVSNRWLENLPQGDLSELAVSRAATFQPDLLDDEDAPADDEDSEDSEEPELDDMEK